MTHSSSLGDCCTPTDNSLPTDRSGDNFLIPPSYHADFNPVERAQPTNTKEKWDDDGDLIEECESYRQRCGEFEEVIHTPAFWNFSPFYPPPITQLNVTSTKHAPLGRVPTKDAPVGRPSCGSQLVGRGDERRSV